MTDQDEEFTVDRETLELLIEGSSHLYECAFPEERAVKIREAKDRVEEQIKEKPYSPSDAQTGDLVSVELVSEKGKPIQLEGVALVNVEPPIIVWDRASYKFVEGMWAQIGDVYGSRHE